MKTIPQDNIYDLISGQLQASAELKLAMKNHCAKSIADAAKLIAETLSHPGGKVMLCGNGGSAADSQHLATEFTVRLSAARPRKALAAIALTTDTSTLTAAANDFGLEMIFARQVEALGNPGDVLICISTSGNSPNVVKAAETAKANEVKLIGFLGENPGKLGGLMDVSVNIPSKVTNRIQEGHITAGHIIVGLVEDLLFGRMEA